jgi:hypothetical protein
LAPITRAMEERPNSSDVAEPHEGPRPVEPDAFTGAPTKRLPAHHADGLHICPSCRSHLVYPTDWAPAEASNWTVELRCPDCEWAGGGTYTQAVVDRFDESLDDGTEALLDDLNILTRSNMEERIDAFVAAMWADLILPEDF